MDMSIRMRPSPPPPRILVSGVSGSGKSTIGRLLAIRLGLRFVEGSELRSEAGCDFEAVTAVMAAAANDGVVLACAVLKRRERDRLRAAAPGLRLVHLHGDGACLAERLRRRDATGPAVAQLPSQLEALELPLVDEHALVVEVARAPEHVVGELLRRLQVFAT